MSWSVGQVLVSADLVGREVAYRWWVIDRLTPAGAWLVDFWSGRRRWVRRGTRFASETEDEAVRLAARARNARRSQGAADNQPQPLQIRNAPLYDG